MPSNPAKPFLVARTDDPQLQLLNANIAKLAAAKPAGRLSNCLPVKGNILWVIARKTPQY